MNNSIFTKIEQRSVGEEVVNAIRDAVINGKIEFGTHLTEAELSEQFNVSRIPIREAFRLLEQEGLVLRQPNRGCFVIKFTPTDVVEVFSLRAALECMGFEWIINSLNEDDFLYLRDIIKKQEEAVNQKDFPSLAKLDMQFHEYLLTKGGHTRLLKVWYEQHAQCRMLLNLRFRVWAEYTPETVLGDHSEIIKALEERDLSKVIHLTKGISERVSRECIQALEAMNLSH